MKSAPPSWNDAVSSVWQYIKQGEIAATCAAKHQPVLNVSVVKMGKRELLTAIRATAPGHVGNLERKHGINRQIYLGHGRLHEKKGAARRSERCQ
jgi:hypothetical protein